MKVTITTWTEGERIIQETDIAGEVTRTVCEIAATQMEEAVKKRLMALGWTPPADTGGH